MKKRKTKRWIVSFVVTDRPKLEENETFMTEQDVRSELLRQADWPAGMRLTRLKVAEDTRPRSPITMGKRK